MLEVQEVLSSSLYAQQLKKLYLVGKVLGLEEDILQSLSTPERVIQVKITIRGEDHKLKTFIGWRSQHNSALGPYKGGVRYHPNVTQDEVIALSMIMTWKNSLLQLPYGGGKGGIKVDTKLLSKKELEQISRSYVESINKYVGSEIDVPAPDVNTDSQTMSWFLDQYIRTTGKIDFGSFTGKPVELGGLAVREYSTGLGVATIAKEAASKILGGLEGRSVAIQGFGNLSYYAAKFINDFGGRVVAVSDSKGGVYDEKGLNLNAVKEAKEKYGSVTEYKEAKRITNDELLLLDCDVLIPGALENVITKYNAPKVKAKLIVEGANGPLTADADEIMRERNLPVMPDILANSGGVVGSYIEWANNKMGEIMEEEEAKRLIVSRMEKAFNEMYKMHGKLGNVDFRTAAMAIAVDRVVRAMKFRGSA